MHVVTSSKVELVGVLHQKVWAREKTKRTTGYQDRKRAIEQKESHRWLESLELTQQWIPVQPDRTAPWLGISNYQVGMTGFSLPTLSCSFPSKLNKYSAELEEYSIS
jgi:hypothetical protein